jgi:hypothetical protein
MLTIEKPWDNLGLVVGQTSVILLSVGFSELFQAVRPRPCDSAACLDSLHTAAVPHQGMQSSCSWLSVI